MPVSNILTYIPWVNAYWSEDPSSGLPADGAAVSSWHDSGSRALNMVQATGALQPVMRASVSALNNKPAVEFTSHVLASAAGSAVAQPYTHVLIGRIRSLPGVGVIGTMAPVGATSATRGMAINANTAWRYEVGANASGGAAPTTGPHVFFGFASGASSTFQVDDVSTAFSSAGNTATINATSVGGRGASEPSAIDVVFYGVIGRALTATEKNDIRIWATLNYSTPGAVMQATLGALAASATAGVSHDAVLAAALGALAAAATAVPVHPATLAAPLGALTAAAAATVTTPAVQVDATLAAPLGGLAAAATATPAHDAVLAAPLGALVASAASVPVHPATLAAPLGSLAASATAGVEHPATLAAPLGGLVAAASAVVGEPAIFDAPLGGLAASVTASVSHDATLAAPLGQLTAGATGAVEVAAQAAAVLGGLLAVVQAGVELQASASADLGGLSASASAVTSRAAAFAALLGPLVASATATVFLPRDVTLAYLSLRAAWTAELLAAGWHADDARAGWSASTVK